MWMGNFKGYRRTWSENEILDISSFMKTCNDTRPKDLHRSIRPLNYINNWKATEFRTFLLYVGIVALHNRLSENEYELFLMLFCAVTICSASVYMRYLPLARNLFIDFIEHHISIFGEASITMNIHNTSHVVDDVDLLGPLDTISAYKFENHLYWLKMKLKHCHRPLQQVVRRVVESIHSTKVNAEDPKFPILKNPFTLDEGTVGFSYIEYKSNVFLSSVRQNIKDIWFLTHEHEIVEFHHVLKEAHKDIVIIGSALKTLLNFFEKPCNSSYLNIHLSDCEKVERKQYKMCSIKAKMFRLHLNNSQSVFIPLLHSL